MIYRIGKDFLVAATFKDLLSISFQEELENL